MSRRRKPAPPPSHQRWLVSYADFVTLLFAFFVVLYASSQVDQRKVGRLALAIQVAFQELGIFQASTTRVPLDVAGADALQHGAGGREPAAQCQPGPGRPSTRGGAGRRRRERRPGSAATGTGGCPLPGNCPQGNFRASRARWPGHQPPRSRIFRERIGADENQFPARLRPHRGLAARAQIPLAHRRSYRQCSHPQLPIFFQLGTLHRPRHRNRPRADRERRLRASAPLRRRVCRISPHREQPHQRGSSHEPPRGCRDPRPRI